MASTRILTVELVERSGDRRRLQYQVYAQLQRNDWNTIIGALDHHVGQIVERQQQEIAVLEQARIERGRVQGQ